MIQIVPAIDIIGGRCVRLSQGDFSRQRNYDITPVEMASRFIANGFSLLHVVDLDGAKNGAPLNLDSLKAIANLGNVEIEWGGGVKTRRDVDAVLEAGASRVVFGTLAVRNPLLFKSFLNEYGADKIVLGADVKGDKVAVSGWTETSETGLSDLIRSFIPGLSDVIVTEISRDGMFSGSNPFLFKRLMEEFPGLIFTASGGIGSVQDIQALDDALVPRVIVGKALYEGRIKLEDLALWHLRKG